MRPHRLRKRRNKEGIASFCKEVLVDHGTSQSKSDFFRQYTNIGRATLIDSLIVGYDIDFVRLNGLEIHIRVFGRTITLPFLGLIQ